MFCVGRVLKRRSKEIYFYSSATRRCCCVLCFVFLLCCFVSAALFKLLGAPPSLLSSSIYTSVDRPQPGTAPHRFLLCFNLHPPDPSLPFFFFLFCSTSYVLAFFFLLCVRPKWVAAVCGDMCMYVCVYVYTAPPSSSSVFRHKFGTAAQQKGKKGQGAPIPSVDNSLAFTNQVGKKRILSTIEKR